jgi:LysR family glycine cleavage system transcriptional activator
MRLRIPSTAALCAFEAAVRHQSFTKAADELAVTQSAVCRQIATLEDALETKLFRRTRRGVVVSEAGESYARKVRSLLTALERDTRDLIASGSVGRTLELGVVPTFATNWLLPRLGRFNAKHSNITINLSVQIRPFLFDEVPLDAAIYSGAGPWPGTEGVFLMNETVVPVASPKLLAGLPALQPDSLLTFTLLHAKTRTNGWHDWFLHQGVKIDDPVPGPRYDLFSMQAKAAINGLGVALLPEFLVQEQLEAGELVYACNFVPTRGRSYFLIFPPLRKQNSALDAFCNWIENEAKGYREEVLPAPNGPRPAPLAFDPKS